MNETLPTAPVSNPAPKTSGLAVTSLVLGILSLTCLLSIITAIPGVICGHISLSKIKNSAGALGGRGLAIAGLITSYVGIALLLMMIVMAIPNFQRARAQAMKTVCNVNIQQIEHAKQQWAMENKKSPTDVPTEKDLAPYLPNGMPKCLAGGTYTINTVGQQATCSFPGHSHSE